jgi:hypothetical protein
MFCRVVLDRIICKIFLPSFPVDVELFLLMPLVNPRKAHIHSFQPALKDSVSEDTNGTFVVKLKRGGTLQMAHLLEDGKCRDSIFGIDKSGSCFRFLDGGHDGVDDFAVEKNWCIVPRRWVIRADRQLWFLGEIVIATVAGACFRFVEIRGMGVKPEVHTRGFVFYASVGMSGSVIKKQVYAKTDVFPRASGYGRGNGADGSLHGVVDGTGVVVEDAGIFLT